MTGKMISAMAVAVLSIGVAAAQTNSASGVDWRYGRPGVFVVTNAEPAVTTFLSQRTITVNGVSGSPVSNLVFNVEGGSGGGSVASVNGQTGVVTITAASVGALTNEADAAALAKLATHTNRVDNPHGVTAAQVGAPSIAALYTLMATSRIDRIWESSNAWWTFESNMVTRTTVIFNLDDCIIVSGAGSSEANGLYYSNGTMEYGYFVYTNAVTPEYQVRHSDLDYFVIWQFGTGELYSSITDSIDGQYTAVGGTQPPPTVTLFAQGYHTNSTVYYLQTNLVPPETWSRNDMSAWISTNQYVSGSWADYIADWMADGNAGQLWASDLAAIAANVLLNDHKRATNAHEGVYPLQTGGTLTNATLAGTVTIDGKIVSVSADNVTAAEFVITNPVTRMAFALDIEVVTNTFVSSFPTDSGGTLTNGLLAYYPMDNSRNVVSGHMATEYGSPTYVAGKVANSVSLSGTQYLTERPNPAERSTDLSAFCWVYLVDNLRSGVFFHSGSETGNGFGFSLGVGSGNFDNPGNSLILLLESLAWVDFGANIGTGWHYVGLTRSSADGIWRGWVDGVVYTPESPNSSDSYSTAGGLHISYGAEATPRRFTGRIDEFGFWGRVLTQSEVNDLYNGGNGQTPTVGIAVSGGAITARILN